MSRDEITVRSHSYNVDDGQIRVSCVLTAEQAKLIDEVAIESTSPQDAIRTLVQDGIRYRRQHGVIAERERSATEAIKRMLEEGSAVVRTRDDD